MAIFQEEPLSLRTFSIIITDILLVMLHYTVKITMVFKSTLKNKYLILLKTTFFSILKILILNQFYSRIDILDH